MRKFVLWLSAAAFCLCFSISAAAGWEQTDSGRQYRKDGRFLSKSWLRDTDGKWYYLDEKGIAATGWVQLSGQWYFLASDGVMQTGWVESGGVWYYLSDYGSMLKNAWTPDGYYVDGTGAYIPGADESISEQEITVGAHHFDGAAATAVIDLVNQRRRENGLSPLATDDILKSVSDIRAGEIVSHFSHKRPDGSYYHSLLPRQYSQSGENIAMGYSDAAEVMRGWMNSDGHRANILKPEYTHIGVTCFVDGGTKYWVQVFGTK